MIHYIDLSDKRKLLPLVNLKNFMIFVRHDMLLHGYYDISSLDRSSLTKYYNCYMVIMIYTLSMSSIRHKFLRFTRGSNLRLSLKTIINIYSWLLLVIAGYYWLLLVITV